MSSNVRTRFAPSPTGYLHVGGIRTALFAWLLARQNNGQFILRIEDTDQAREVEGSRQHIIDSLTALGLDYDEGPEKDGGHGPYLQSQRLDIYKKWANKLIESGRAYADPYSKEELDDLRTKSKEAKKPFLFRDHRPEDPPTWDGTMPLRFKSDPKPYTSDDAVMGKLETSPEAIDDFILIKSDGFPTYNFAHIVDDIEMKVSHVIRGQEFLASIPNYRNLYEALNVTPPVYATVPHIMGPDGKKKLSKRDGARDILEYINEGYLPEALISFIATLGWNDGTTQEVFTTSELTKKFSLERVQKSGAHFDERRLLWTNGHFIRQLKSDDLYEKVNTFWPESAEKFDEEYRQKVLGLVQERLKYFAELPKLTSFFFEDLPVDKSLIENNKQLKKYEPQKLQGYLKLALESIEESDFSTKDLSDRLNKLLAAINEKPAVLFSLIRIATTRAPASPGLAETIEVLGKERTLRRLKQQIEALA